MGSTSTSLLPLRPLSCFPYPHSNSQISYSYFPQALTDLPSYIHFFPSSMLWLPPSKPSFTQGSEFVAILGRAQECNSHVQYGPSRIQYDLKFHIITPHHCHLTHLEILHIRKLFHPPSNNPPNSWTLRRYVHRTAVKGVWLVSVCHKKKYKKLCL